MKPARRALASSTALLRSADDHTLSFPRGVTAAGVGTTGAVVASTISTTGGEAGEASSSALVKKTEEPASSLAMPWVGSACSYGKQFNQ